MKDFFLFINITACCNCVFKGKALHTNVPLNDKMCLGMKMEWKCSLTYMSATITAVDAVTSGKNMCRLGKILWPVFRPWSSEM